VPRAGLVLRVAAGQGLTPLTYTALT